VNEFSRIKEAVDFIRQQADIKPSVGVVLGSGMSNVLSTVKIIAEIPYARIPNFPLSSVEGHKGTLCIGEINNKHVCILRGRVHYYEGFEPQQVVFPVRVLRVLGIDFLILTNAAGGLNERFAPGDLMLIIDHVNLSGINPLRGKNIQELGPRFPDLTQVYDRELIKLARKVDATLLSGVYAMMPGPTYETPAEVKMLRILGIDAIGMSTVPEVIAAVHCGMRVLAISFIANKASGLGAGRLSHQEVIKSAQKIEGRLSRLIEQIIKRL
jgi:purine-nucleoside phosphorylase